MHPEQSRSSDSDLIASLCFSSRIVERRQEAPRILVRVDSARYRTEKVAAFDFWPSAFTTRTCQVPTVPPLFT